MTTPGGGTFADANVKATLTWGDIEKQMTPRLEAELKKAQKVVEKHADRIEAASSRMGRGISDDVSRGAAGAAREVDRRMSEIDRRVNRTRPKITIDVDAQRVGQAVKGVESLMSTVTRLSKVAAIGTLGLPVLIGLAAGASKLIGGPMIQAVTALGAAMGVAAGAAVGILAPAIVALKVGFAGLSDGAKKFMENFKEADDALAERIGNMMGPLLTAWHDASSQMKLAFAGALDPAFKNMAGLVGTLRPQLVGLSTLFGNIGTRVSQSLSQGGAQGFRDMIAGAHQFFTLMDGENGLGGLTSGLVSFAGTAAKTFANVGGGLGDAMLSAGDWLRNISPDQMRAAFDQLKQVFDNIMSVAVPVFNVLRQFGQISAPALAPGFRALGDAIVQATPGLLQMARELMPALGQALQNLAPIIPSLVQAFSPWATVVAVLAPHIASLVAALGPFAPLILVGAGALKVATGVLANLTALTKGFQLAMTVASVAARGLGIAMTVATGPIGIVIAAVAAIGVALWAFFTKTETGRALWNAIWTGIKTAVQVVVQWFQTSVLPVLKTVWDGIAQGATWLWQNIMLPAWEGIKTVIGVAVQIVSAYITGWKAVFSAVGAVVTWLWQNIVTPAWEGIKTAISVAMAIISPLFTAFKIAIQLVGIAISAWWEGVAKPVFGLVGSFLSATWENAIKPVWDAFKAAIGWVGDKIQWFWQNVVQPGMEMVKSAIAGMWAKVEPIWTDFKRGLQVVSDGAEKFKELVGKAFDWVRDRASAMWNFVGDKLEKISGFLSKVPGASLLTGDGHAAGGIVGRARGGLARFAGGGQITGPGGPRSDSILGWPAMVAVSNSEFVTNARSTAANLPLISAINAANGRFDLARWLGLARFATGGRVAYGLPVGTNTGGYGSSGAVFPDWVHALEQRFGVKASTYAGHQETSGLNKGIDWTGSVTNMQRFAEFLATIPGELEQVIWQNPNTGQTIGIADGQFVGPNTSQPGYYRDDWKDHRNHVHTRSSYSFGAASSGTPWLGGAGTGAGGGYGGVGTAAGGSLAGSAGGGTTSSGGTTSGSTGGGRQLTAQEEAARIPLAMLEAAFGIKLPSWLDPTAQTPQATATTANTQAIQQNTAALTGQPAVPLNVPQATAGAGTAQPGRLYSEGSTLGSLTASSSKQDIARGIYNEAIARGYSGEQAKAILSTALQESGLNPAAQGGGGAWHGIFQQDSSYAGRDTPSSNIGAFFDRLDQKTKTDPNSDIWQRIFWLQQRPGEKSAAAAVANGRQAYLSEIKSQQGAAESLIKGMGGTTASFGGGTAVPQLASTMPFQQLNTTVTPQTGLTPQATPSITPTTYQPSTTPTVTPAMNTTDGQQTAPQLITGDTGTSNNTGGDLVTSGIGWAGDATKEIVGQFLAPFGLDGLFGKGVDMGTNAAKAGWAQGQKAINAGVQAAGAAGAATGNPALAAAGAVGGGATAVFNQQITTADPKEAVRQSVRAVGDGMTPVTNHLRSP